MRSQIRRPISKPEAAITPKYKRALYEGVTSFIFAGSMTKTSACTEDGNWRSCACVEFIEVITALRSVVSRAMCGSEELCMKGFVFSIVRFGPGTGCKDFVGTCV